MQQQSIGVRFFFRSTRHSSDLSSHFEISSKDYSVEDWIKQKSIFLFASLFYFAPAVVKGFPWRLHFHKLSTAIQVVFRCPFCWQLKVSSRSYTNTFFSAPFFPLSFSSFLFCDFDNFFLFDCPEVASIAHQLGKLWS